MKPKKRAYSDSPEVTAKEDPRAEFMAYCTRQARENGVTLDQFMSARSQALDNLDTLRRQRHTLDYQPEGPVLNLHNPDDRAYHEACALNIARILRNEITPQDAATAILRRFPGLSASAMTAWARLADGPQERL